MSNVIAVRFIVDLLNTFIDTIKIIMVKKKVQLIVLTARIILAVTVPRVN